MNKAIAVACVLVACLYAVSGMTDADRKAFVDAHNKYRAKVKEDYPCQKPISDLNKVTWDSTIENVAQTYTNTCPGGHSGNSYGENIYYSSGVGTATASVDSWYSEVKDYHYEVISYDNYAKFGHYTQLVWNSTTRIGCGIKTDCPGTWRTIIVCNYAPAGNYIGQRPWTAASEVCDGSSIMKPVVGLVALLAMVALL